MTAQIYAGNEKIDIKRRPKRHAAGAEMAG